MATVLVIGDQTIPDRVKWFYETFGVMPGIYCAKHKLQQASVWRDLERGYCNVVRKGGKHSVPPSHPIYQTWSAMRRRCYDEDFISYANYGGKGVTVHYSWYNSFEVFYRDMHASWFPDASLDRIDNNSGYRPDNCRWATKEEQGQNTCRTKLTPEIVRQIRSTKFKKGDKKKLAAQLNVGIWVIKAVLANKTWKNIEV